MTLKEVTLPDNPREYGLGSSTQYVRGIPRIKQVIQPQGGCPNCGCVDLFEVEVEVDHPQLVGGKGIGVFFGCACCTFASPMMMVSRAAAKGVSADPPTPNNHIHKKENES